MKIVFLIFFSLIKICAAYEVKDAINHISFDVPSGWDIIPLENLREMENKYETMFHIVPQKYDGGLFLKSQSDKYFGYPYVLYKLIPIKDLNTIKFNDIIRQISTSLTSENINYEYINRKTIYSDFTSNILLVDTNKYMFLYNITTNDSTGRKLKTFLAVSVGAQGLLYFYCYSTEKEFQVHFPAFRSLINSISFDKSFQYNESKYNWYRPISLIIVISGVMYYINLRKKSKKLEMLK